MKEMWSSATFVVRCAGHWDWTDWTLEVAACQQLKKPVISSYLQWVTVTVWAVYTSHGSPNKRIKVFYQSGERWRPEAVLHSARSGAVVGRSQIHLGSLPSVAGPGSTGVQRCNSVGSCWRGRLSLSYHARASPDNLWRWKSGIVKWILKKPSAVCEMSHFNEGYL